MGWLGCPLCCCHQFPSVAGLHDHLLYFIYRPLQCGVCGASVAGVNHLTRHLQDHMGEGALALRGHQDQVSPALPEEDQNDKISLALRDDQQNDLVFPALHYAGKNDGITSAFIAVEKNQALCGVQRNEDEVAPALNQAVCWTERINSATVYLGAAEKNLDLNDGQESNRISIGDTNLHPGNINDATTHKKERDKDVTLNLCGANVGAPNLQRAENKSVIPVLDTTEVNYATSSRAEKNAKDTITLYGIEKSSAVIEVDRNRSVTLPLHGIQGSDAVVIGSSYQVTVTSDRVNVTSERANVTSERVNVTSDHTNVTSDRANVTSDRANVTSNRVNVTSDRANVTSDRVNITSDCDANTSSQAAVLSGLIGFGHVPHLPTNQDHPPNATAPHIAGSITHPTWSTFHPTMIQTSATNQQAGSSQHPTDSPMPFSDPPVSTPLPSISISHPPVSTPHLPVATPHPLVSTPHPPVSTPHPLVYTPHPPVSTPHPPSHPSTSTLHSTVPTPTPPFTSSHPQISTTHHPSSSATHPPHSTPHPTHTTPHPTQPIFEPTTYSVSQHVLLSYPTSHPNDQTLPTLQTHSVDSLYHPTNPALNTNDPSLFSTSSRSTHSIPPPTSLIRQPASPVPLSTNTIPHPNQSSIISTSLIGQASINDLSLISTSSSPYPSSNINHHNPYPPTNHPHSFFSRTPRPVSKNLQVAQVDGTLAGQGLANDGSQAAGPSVARTDNINHRNAGNTLPATTKTKPLRELSEQILHAYVCQTCGEKVVGQDTYFLHISQHSLGQEEGSPWSQHTPDVHPQLTPHSQYMSDTSTTPSQYTSDTPLSQYTPDTPHTLNTPNIMNPRSPYTQLTPPGVLNPTTPQSQHNLNNPHTSTTVHLPQESQVTPSTPPPLLHSQNTPNTFDPQRSSPASLSDIDVLNSPLISAESTPGNVTTDTDTVNESANPSECLSDCMDEEDTAKQLLKLREWQLGKLSKSFRRHKVSFGKSPSEQSPMSSKMGSIDSPWNPSSVLDHRPSSQESFPSQSDEPPASVDMSSIEQPPSYADPGSSEFNISSEQTEVNLNSKYNNNDTLGRDSKLAMEPDSYSPPLSVPLVDKKVHTPIIYTAEQPALQTPVGQHSVYTDPCSQELTNTRSLMPHSDFVFVPEHQVNQIFVPSSYHSTGETNHTDQAGKPSISQTLQEPCGTPYTSEELPHTHNWVTPHQSVRYLEMQPASALSQCTDNQHIQEPGQVEIPSNQSLALLYSGSNKKETSNFENEESISDEKLHNATTENQPNLALGIPMPNTREESENVNKSNTDKSAEEEISHSPHRLILDDHTNFPMDHEIPRNGSDDVDSDSSLQKQKSTDTMPYLHKKFHHDQDRKVVLAPTQNADVSRYIHSYQSLLVNRLNGTLTSNIPFAPSVCPSQETVAKTERNTANTVPKPQPQQTNFKDNVCEVCQVTSVGRSAYKAHYKSHEVEGQKNFTCQFCPKRFYRKCSKDLHERRHTGKQIMRCERCPQVFTKEYSFQRHKQEVHAAKKTFICAECSEGFSTERRLKDHIEVHQRDKAHRCFHCTHSCHTASGLRTHIMEKHTLANPHKHSCDICGEKFSKKYGLIRHKKRKHERESLCCLMCTKEFSCKEDLLQHTKSHNEGETIKCEECDKTFSTGWDLKRHAKSHQENPQQFKCKKCPAKFTRKDSLKIHLRIHAQKKAYVCFCGKRFVKSSQLREHQDSHSETPRYTCQTCHKVFKFKVSVRNHSCIKTPDIQAHIIKEGHTTSNSTTATDEQETHREDSPMDQEFGVEGKVLEELTAHKENSPAGQQSAVDGSATRGKRKRKK